MSTTLQYRILHDRLKKEILTGIYKIGDTLPSENELCLTENIARSTVRHALSQLEKEGYIVKHRGKGSIVTSRRRALGVLSFQGFSASVKDSPISALSVQVAKLSSWPDNFFFPLSETEARAGCISFSRVRLIEKDPVMWETTYIPNLNLPKFTQLFRIDNSFFEFLGLQYHVEITGMEQELWAINADAEAASRMKIKKGAAILLIHRKYFTNRPGLNVYSKLYCTTDKYAMSNSSGVKSHQL